MFAETGSRLRPLAVEKTIEVAATGAMDVTSKPTQQKNGQFSKRHRE